MNREFKRYAGEMEQLLKELLACPQISITDGSEFPDKPGVYLISKGKRALYVGRSRSIKKRIANHRGASPHSSTFAFRLACNALGWKPSYTRGKGRASLMKQRKFKTAFKKNVSKIREMTARFVEVKKDETQYLFEFYVHVSLKTPHNLWATH
jgi:predicted GIY-YIG superfamily endonuclease